MILYILLFMAGLKLDVGAFYWILWGAGLLWNVIEDLVKVAKINRKA